MLSTKKHPSNNYQMMTYEVQNTAMTTSKTIILENENHMTTISLNQYFQDEYDEKQDQQQMTLLADDDYQEVVDDSSTLKNDFCQSPQCVISASKMEYLIDWKVDPCENFYNFACGSFIRDSTLHDRRDFIECIYNDR